MRTSTLSRIVPAFGLIVLLLFVAACDESDSTGSEAAHVQIKLTDAPFPFDLVAEANVVVTDVILKGGEADSVILSDDSQPFNLLELQDGVTATLADVEIEPDTYNQLRVVVDESATVVLHEGDEYNLKIPSGSQSGIKILLNNLTIEDGDLVIVTVDFDIEDSFVVQGNPDTPAGIRGFIFKPVIRAESIVVNGEEIPDDAG